MKILKSFKARTTGFTLVELGIVIAIAAIIIGVGLAVVPNMMATTRANAENVELPAIATKIQRLYSTQGSYAGLLQINLAQSNIWNPANVAAATPFTVTNRWGGTTSVATTAIIVANDGFVMTETNVPQAECMQISQSISSSARIVTGGTTAGLSLMKNDATPFVPSALLGCNATNVMQYTWGK